MGLEGGRTGGRMGGRANGRVKLANQGILDNIRPVHARRQQRCTKLKGKYRLTWLIYAFHVARQPRRRAIMWLCNVTSMSEYFALGSRSSRSSKSTGHIRNWGISQTHDLLSYFLRAIFRRLKRTMTPKRAALAWTVLYRNEPITVGNENWS